MRSTRTDFIRAAGATAASLAALGGPLQQALAAEGTARLYEAAKKEGSLTWWTAHYTQGTAERVRDAFKTKYPGIEVSFIRQTAQVVYQRLNQDLASGVHQVDVFASTDEAHFPELKKRNALATYVPEDVAHLAPHNQHIDSDNTYQTGALALMLLQYNPKKGSAPHKWADLQDPKYKGKVTLGHPGFSGFVGAWVLAMNDKFGWDYFKKLAENQPKIGRSAFDTVTDIVSGEREVGAGPDSLSLERKAAGNAIEVSYPQDDAILIVSPVAVLKDAPHPNAARLFMNFYYSKEYSDAMFNTFNLPLLPGVAAAYHERLDRIKTYRNTRERLQTGIPEVIAKWRETFNV